MAIPPEPIEEVLPQAEAAVLGEIARVVVQDPQKPAPPHEPGATSVPSEAARQVVELKVSEVLFGAGDSVKPGATLEVIKPAGDYALRAGNHGPFLLKNEGKTIQIVGRYGPDTYSADAIRSAARRAGRS